MRDKHVREKLSEYIDGTLSAKEAAAVKAHLERCPQCMDEYEDMLKIIGHMSQMESFETPASFLDQVHQRMEQPSSFQRLVTKLFVPLKIKIPLELAGVAAAALLVIYIVGIRGRPNVYELAYIQSQSMLQEQKPKKGTQVEAPSLQRKKVGHEQEPEEKLLEMGGKRADEKDAFASSKKDVAALAPTEKRNEKRARVKEAVPQSQTVADEAEAGHEPQEKPVEREAQVEEKASPVTKAEKRIKPGFETVDKEQEEPAQDALSKPALAVRDLEDIILLLGGKIIESEYDKDTQVLESLTIEIPAESYQKLIKELEGRGDIQEPYPVIQEKGQDTIRVRIKLRKR